ncbi:MAG: UvrD-helicase domain-containing protein, partial [Bdellovibrionales bacterium]|nr:UvrD-helicase domain-containing protein [Bdellovibrionales bacterium]
MSGLHERPVGEALWRAGAGAGKTYNLVLRVMRIAEEWAAKNDGALPRLVVTTFTRMATQELRVRLMEAALRAADEGRKELIPFVTSRSQLFVTTLHGVMDSYLRSFGSEIGLEPGFRVGGSEEISAMVRRVGKKVLFPAAAEEQLATDVDVLLSEFDFSTTLALLMRVSRIQAEFDGSDQPARPASKHEMIDSMRAHLLGTAPAVLALRAEICAAGPHPKWQPYADWLLKIVKALETNKSEAALDERAFRTRIESLLELLSDEPSIRNVGEHKIEFDQGAKWKNAWKDLQEIAESVLGECDSLEKFELVNAALARVEQNFSRVLREEKFRQGLIELEDLEILALELVRKFPESAKTYAEGWDHWLIDEYQDTSPRQVQLIQALAQERPQFVVGDPQQSIYMFRGARPHVFLERERKANAESHEVVGLQGNRRSHPEVMAFINEAVERLGDEFQEMTAERVN